MAVSAKVITNWYVTEPVIGAALNLDQPISVTTAPETPAPWTELGKTVLGNSGSVWMFVQASTTVTSGNVVAIDANYQANDASTVIVSSIACVIGVAQFAANLLQSTLTQQTAQPGDYFWACLQAASGLQINCAVGSCLRGTQLYISSATPGSVTTSVSASALQGIFANTTYPGGGSSGSDSVTDFLSVGPMRVSQ
jgi:hypothetical protein